VSDQSDSTVGAEDVAALNRAMVERAAAFTRIAGTVLIVVGVIGVLAAVWFIVREQQQLDSGGMFGGNEGDVSLLDRFDVFTTRFAVFELPALVAGAGLALRLLADYATARTGGTLTGYEVGDEMPDIDTPAP
jgi:hypothetical protein